MEYLLQNLIFQCSPTAWLTSPHLNEWVGYDVSSAVVQLHLETGSFEVLPLKEKKCIDTIFISTSTNKLLNATNKTGIWKYLLPPLYQCQV